MAPADDAALRWRVDTTARLIIFAGIGFVVLGLLLLGASRLGLGRLPGDIFVDRGNVKIAVPLMTSLIVSLVLTVVLNVVVRFWR
jgi:hypothetical protein